MLLRLLFLDEVNFWSTTKERSHLRGGFRYRNGKLVVPRTGHYFIYSQIWNYDGVKVRHYVYSGERRLAVAGASSGDSQTTWAGGVFYLRAGQGIHVKIGRRSSRGERTIWPGSAHTYFGAFMV